MSTVATARPISRIQALAHSAARGSEWLVLRWLVPLALIQGLIFLAIVPPWQHYDEPSHFVYAAGIAAGEAAGGGPKAVMLSREIADSMYRHSFWPEDLRPEMLSVEGPALGENQRVHPRLYYAIVAAPLTVVRFLPIEQQLYTARAVSVIFYVLTIVAAWRIAVAAFPDDPLMQLALPLLLLLTPPFADLMTAVNNDVPVNFAATASLLGAVLLLRHGPRPAHLALMLLGLLAALLTKRSAIPLIVPTAIVIYWSFQSRDLPRWALPTAAAVAIALVGALSLRPVIAEGPTGPHWIFTARPWLATLASSYLRVDLDAWVRSVSDADLIGDRYQRLLVVGFVSFWTRFGWGGVSPGPIWDWAFAALAALASLGLLVGALRGAGPPQRWQRRAIRLCLIMVICAWLVIFARFHPLPPLGEWTYFPRGRYIFWAIVPHLWLMALGLRQLVAPPLRHLPPLALLGFFAVYMVAGYVTNIIYYQR